MPSPTDRNLTALPTKTVKPTRRRQTRHFTQLDQVTQLARDRHAHLAGDLRVLPALVRFDRVPQLCAVLRPRGRLGKGKKEMLNRATTYALTIFLCGAVFLLSSCSETAEQVDPLDAALGALDNPCDETYKCVLPESR